MIAPMMTPPDSEAKSPSKDTPPFVPGGTHLNVVIRSGELRESMPSSEASVSPRQHAKCLEVKGYNV